MAAETRVTQLLTELLERCRRGEADAVTTLVKRFEPWAHNLAGRILGDEHLAEDAVQAAFLRAFSRLAELRDPAAFPGWLRQIIRSEAQLIIRRGSVVDEPDKGAVAAGLSPAEEVALGELRQIVAQSLAELPAVSRESAELYYLRERSCAEVAELLGVPVGTVKRRLHDARAQLRELLPAGLRPQSYPHKQRPRSAGETSL